jgi:hypothetical protein
MPRDITITFSDGTKHQYNNTPDSVTPDDIEKRAKKDYPTKKISNISGGKKKSAGGPLSADPISANARPKGSGELDQVKKNAGLSTTPQSGSNKNWKFDNVKGSDIDSPGRQVFSVISKNTVDLGFPYGKTKMNLHIRIANGKLDPNGGIFVTSAGQFYEAGSSSGMGEGTLKMKFDNEPAQSYAYGGSSSGSTGTAFITHLDDNFLIDLARKLENSKLLKIQISYFHHGKEIFEFDISGLKLNLK